MGRRLKGGMSGAQLSAICGKARHLTGVKRGPEGMILLSLLDQSCKEFVGRYELHESHAQSTSM